MKPVSTKLAVALAIFASSGLTTARGDSAVLVREQLANRPQQFEISSQRDARLRSIARGSGFDLVLAPGEVILELRDQTAVRMSMAGCRREARVQALDQIPGTTHYFIGSDPKRWRTNMPTHDKLLCANVYLGSSTNFPTVNPYQAARSGGRDVFVTKFDPTGTLAASCAIRIFVKE